MILNVETNERDEECPICKAIIDVINEELGK